MNIFHLFNMGLFVFRIDNSEKKTLNNFHTSSFPRYLCQFYQNLAQIMLCFFVYFVYLSLTPTYRLMFDEQDHWLGTVL